LLLFFWRKLIRVFPRDPRLLLSFWLIVIREDP